jgi:hypothetical protein
MKKCTQPSAWFGNHAGVALLKFLTKVSLNGFGLFPLPTEIIHFQGKVAILVPDRIIFIN